MNKPHIKKLFSQSVYYGTGLVLNRSLGTILLPLYTLYFSTADLGMYSIIYSIWLFVNAIYILGLETSFLKFFIASDNNSVKAETYSSTIASVTMTSLLFSAIIFYFSDNISQLIEFSNLAKGAYLIKILAVMLFVDALYRFPLLLLRAELKAKVYFVLTLVTLVVNLTLNFVFIISFNMNIEAIMYSYIASAGVTFILSLIVTRGYLKPVISFERIKKMISFGFKFIWIGLLIIIIDQSDRFFLKYFFDESVAGIYQAVYRLAAVMGLIITTFKFAWTPYFLNLEKNPENKKIISNIFTYYIFASTFMLLFFSFFTEHIVKLKIFNISFLDENYWQGLNILPYLFLAYFFSGIFSFLNVAPFFSNKTFLLLIVTLIGVLTNLVLNFLIIPSMGMTGAALATFITYFVMTILIYIISQKIYPIPYQLKKISIILINGFIFFIFYIFFKLENPIYNLFLALIYIIVFTIIIQKLANLKLSNVKLVFKRST